MTSKRVAKGANTVVHTVREETANELIRLTLCGKRVPAFWHNVDDMSSHLFNGPCGACMNYAVRASNARVREFSNGMDRAMAAPAGPNFGTANRHIDGTCTRATDGVHCHCTSESYKINTGEDGKCSICGPLVVTSHADGFDQYVSQDTAERDALVARQAAMERHPAGKGPQGREVISVEEFAYRNRARVAAQLLKPAARELTDSELDEIDVRTLDFLSLLIARMGLAASLTVRDAIVSDVSNVLSRHGVRNV